MSGPSRALFNLRGFVILVVLAFHSVLAYLGSNPPAAAPFDDPPFRWRSFPIMDADRWFGFDLFCALHDIYLISLMFFISGLFAWPSFNRKGPRQFLRDRLLRIALPFALAVLVLMPVAHYPAYLQTAKDPSPIGTTIWRCRFSRAGRRGSSGYCSPWTSWQRHCSCSRLARVRRSAASLAR